MNKFDNDIKIESAILTTLNYYKLLYIENLTKDKDYSVFEMLGGTKAFNRLLNDVNNSLFSFDYLNFDIVTNFKNDISKITTIQTSNSPILTKELNNIDWIEDVIAFIEPSDRVCDSILLNSNLEVFNKMVSVESTLRFSQYNKKYLMNKKIDDVKKMIKKYKENDITM